MSFTTRCFR
ncbi:hypothetical protein E2C01_091029 [Portunus trituberculatus]|uniref:Uncharacterized protein n=1 Tax=Portunus trituberculatus TaxID=210409 RepID=A0A5B7JI48_PORTR|nr:hypothetical protein [Portunus trituberculatus]